MPVNNGIPRPPADVDPRIRRALDAIRNLDITEFSALLTAINALTSTAGGILAVSPGATAAAMRTIVAPSAGITISNANGASGDPTLALANDLAGVEGLTTTGVVCRTANNTWICRTLSSLSSCLGFSNGGGISNSPAVFAAGDLYAIESLTIDAWSPGFVCRQNSSSWMARSIQGTTNQINVVNPTGATGNPTLSTPQNIHTGATMTLAGANLTGGGTVGSGTLSLTDGVNVVSGTSTGTKLATSATQKLSFWNATPIVQPASARQAALTDSTTGSTAATTIVNVDTAGVADVSKINDNFARVVLLLNQLRSDMVAAGLIKGSA